MTEAAPHRFSDEFCVADEDRIAELGRLLVHRHGHDAGNAPGEGGVGGRGDIRQRGRTRPRIQDAGTVIRRAQEMGVDHVQVASYRIGRIRDDSDGHVEIE